MALQLLYTHCTSEIQAIEYLRSVGLLRHDDPPYPTCRREMTLIKKSKASENRYWRCPTHKSIKIPLRRGTFWDRSHIDLKHAVELMLLWAYKTPIHTTHEMTRISPRSIVQWFQYFRDICSWWLVQNPYQIGGPGLVVEVDESLMAKRKNEVGRVVEQRWVFGGVCRETRRGFLVSIPDKSAATLLGLIQEHVAPGSIIHTDGLRSYHGIPQIPVVPAYEHLVVNHVDNFVDPQTGACTNLVENYWKNCKRRFKAMLGVQNSLLHGHLDEFMWREIHGKTLPQALDNLIVHISQCYPL